MPGNPQASPAQRQFLRGIAAINLFREPGEQAWWSAGDLRAAWPEDFHTQSLHQLAGTGISCVTIRLAISRRAEGAGQGQGPRWSEWQITATGRALVADSCIGGGLDWIFLPDPGTQVPFPPPGTLAEITLHGTLACPACRSTAAQLGITGPAPDTIPAHPLPAPSEQENES